MKEREQIDGSNPAYNPLALEEDEPASLELHPDRQAMLETPLPAPSQQFPSDPNSRPPRYKRPKAQPFKKEAELAERRREEREARQKEIEERNRQRQAKLEERERFRRAMAKARSGGKDGQRKLGRESKVLLEKVKRIVGGWKGHRNHEYIFNLEWRRQFSTSIPRCGVSSTPSNRTYGFRCPQNGLNLTISQNCSETTPNQQWQRSSPLTAYQNADSHGHWDWRIKAGSSLLVARIKS